MDYKWTALTVTMVGTLMAGIDSTIVVIGLPVVAQQLKAGADEVVWITQAYTLAGTVTVLLIGRITDLFGRVKVYNFGFMIFTVGSALSALSLDPYQLIAFRLVQGIGGGILYTNSSAIVTDASPRKELGTMLGLNQTGIRVGNVTGLVLSGLILSVVDWRGLFYVNIPIGIFGTLWAQRRLREISKKDASKKMDWAGFGLFSSGLTLALVAVTYLSYGLSGTLLGYSFLSVGLILLALFVITETRTRFPLLDPQLFRIRRFAAGNVAQVLNSLAWTGVILLIAFYLEVGLGYTPLQAGLGILPMEVAYLLSTVLTGKLSDRYEPRVLTTLGLALNALALFVASSFGAGTSYPLVAVMLVVVGIGNGLFTVTNLRAIMSAVPGDRIGVASAFRNTMFNVGMMVGYGLVLLVITIGIPYGTFSSLIQGIEPQSMIAVARAEFLDGFRIATVVLAVIDTIAIIPSAMRGKRMRDSEPSQI